MYIFIYVMFIFIFKFVILVAFKIYTQAKYKREL